MLTLSRTLFVETNIGFISDIDMTSADGMPDALKAAVESL